MPHQAAFLFTEVLNNKNLKRKCLGIAKNYFTQAMKTNPRSVVLPQYPYIFSKTLSAYLYMKSNYVLDCVPRELISQFLNTHQRIQSSMK